MLAAVRALDAAGLKTKGDLIFLFTVEEETSFRGVEEFVKANKGRIDQYIALDGGYDGFTYGGIGINWYKHHFIGPGGHTRSSTPPYSATLPMARAIERIYQLQLPQGVPANLNIGMLGGSDVVNAKAADAWFTVDLRSTSNEVIGDLEKKIAAIVKEEAERERMTVRTELMSSTPAAQIPGPPRVSAGEDDRGRTLRDGLQAVDHHHGLEQRQRRAARGHPRHLDRRRPLQQLARAHRELRDRAALQRHPEGHPPPRRDGRS